MGWSSKYPNGGKHPMDTDVDLWQGCTQGTQKVEWFHWFLEGLVPEMKKIWEY